MNLISQNCLAEGLYKLLNTCYQNPFAGTVIAFDSMRYLIDNWDNIDFTNPKLILSDEHYPILILNDVCKIEYVHYIQNANFATPTRRGPNVYYRDVFALTHEKYQKRLNRMLNNAEQPVFCICNFKTIYPTTIYTQDQIDALSKYKNVKILTGVENLEPPDAAKAFYNKYLKQQYENLRSR